jgi:hypothetical protein
VQIGRGRFVDQLGDHRLPLGRCCADIRGLLRCDAAVDDETGAGHEAGVVRGEKDDALGDIGLVPMRPIGNRANAWRRASSILLVPRLRARMTST